MSKCDILSQTLSVWWWCFLKKVECGIRKYFTTSRNHNNAGILQKLLEVTEWLERSCQTNFYLAFNVRSFLDKMVNFSPWAALKFDLDRMFLQFRVSFRFEQLSMNLSD